MGEEGASPDLSRLRIAREEASPRSRAPRWMAWSVLAVGVILGLGYVTLGRSGGAGDLGKVIDIDVFQVPSPNAREGVVLSGSGYVEAQVRADISAKVPGRLEFLEVEEGDRVKRGEILAQLENRDYAARLELARKERVEREGAVVELQAILAEDEREFDRQTRLLAGGVTGRAEQERALARRDATRARLETARAGAESAAARVKVNEAELEYTVIRAPFGGVVIRKMAKVGEMVMPQAMGADTNTKSGIVQLADFNTLEVEVDVQEANIARLGEGQPARVLLKSYRDRPYQALVRQILPTADRAQGTVLVRVRIQDPDTRVLPKMQADVDFLSRPPSQTTHESIEIPRTAVIESGGRTSVLVIESGKLVEREVRLGELRGERMTVLEGLSGGEQVALEPASLEAGTSVRARTGGAS
jgi:RND family efflux transporter MFP subunit